MLDAEVGGEAKNPILQGNRWERGKTADSPFNHFHLSALEECFSACWSRQPDEVVRPHGVAEVTGRRGRHALVIEAVTVVEEAPRAEDRRPVACCEWFGSAIVVGTRGWSMCDGDDVREGCHKEGNSGGGGPF